MRLLLLSVFAILTAACETTPPTIDYTFEEFEPIESEIVDPTPLPSLPKLQCFPSDDDCQVAGYSTTNDIDEFERYKIISEANSEIATANTETAKLLIEREEAILAAAKAQETITNLREEQLDFERKMRQQEKWYYRVLLGLVIGASAYASGN